MDRFRNKQNLLAFGECRAIALTMVWAAAI